MQPPLVGLVGVMLRLILLWFLLVMGDSLLSAYAMKGDLSSRWFRARLMLGIILPLVTIASLSCWRYSFRIAEWLVSGYNGAYEYSALPSNYAQTGCALIGIWFLGNSVPSVVVNLFFFVAQGAPLSDVLLLMQIGASGIKSALGLALVLRSALLGKLLLGCSLSSSATSLED